MDKPAAPPLRRAAGGVCGVSYASVPLVRGGGVVRPDGTIGMIDSVEDFESCMRRR